MTDRPARARVRPPGPFAVAGGALALFFAVLSLLAIQDRLARDPVATAASQPVAVVPRRVLVRRVIETRIVVHVRRSGRTPAPRRVVAAMPVPAPASAAPAPTAAAPAPAPMTTRSS
jgi:hypothetical protein